MHDEHGPRRLRQGNDTPETLLRAIDALRKGVDDGPRLSRVGQKLESVLNAPPTAATTSAHVGQKLSALKLILGGLALLVALTPLLFRQHSDDGAVPGADHDGSPAATTSETQAAPAAQPQTVEVIQPPAAEHTVEEPASPAPSPAPRRASKHTSRSRERASVREAPTERAASDEAVSARAEPPEAPAAIAPKAAPEPSESPKDAQRQTAKLEQPKEAPPVPAEADLLLKARKALRLDPSLALSLATEHQTYYPKGRLVPEREVLAIEALRNLGRKQEAEERLKKFEARYPKSIHLQRLHEGL